MIVRAMRPRSETRQKSREDEVEGEGNHGEDLLYDGLRRLLQHSDAGGRKKRPLAEIQWMKPAQFFSAQAIFLNP